MDWFLEDEPDVVLLAHEKFPHEAKTAVGVLRYGDYHVQAVLDEATAGTRVADHDPTLQDAPIVRTFDDVEGAVDGLIIGIAPFGGGFEERWRTDVRDALEAGCDVVAGLHVPLAQDAEFGRLADEYGCEIHDVRIPPANLDLGRGRAESVDADVVLTVGTDGSVGKMTTCMELLEAARTRGLDAGFVPTGQTGIVIAGWGIAVDGVIADFASGAIERMICEIGDDNDILFVEGQGSINHPAYSADTISCLHGSMAEKLILVHDCDRTVLEGFEEFNIPDPERYVDIYESVGGLLAETNVVAGAIDTSSIDSDDVAQKRIDEYAQAIGAPATDVIRFSADDVLDAVL